MPNGFSRRLKAFENHWTHSGEIHGMDLDAASAPSAFGVCSPSLSRIPLCWACRWMRLWRTYVYQDRKRLLFYVVMASLGSALGSIPLYIIGYLGGEKSAAQAHFGRALPANSPVVRAARILGLDVPRNDAAHRCHSRSSCWVLRVFEMRFRDFLAAVFAGRFVRFLVLALLTLWFGPQIVGVMGTVFRQHFSWVLGAIAGGVDGMAADAAQVAIRRKAPIR